MQCFRFRTHPEAGAVPWIGPRCFGIVALVCACVRTPEAAAEPALREQVQELLLEPDAFAQRYLQLQYGIRATWENGEEGQLLQLNPSLELGASDELTVAVRQPVVVGLEEQGTGGGNPEVGLLYEAFRRDRWSVAASIESTLPSLSGLGVDAFDYEGRVLAYWDIDPVHVQVGPGVQVAHGEAIEEDPDFGPVGAVALIYHLHELAFLAEFALDREQGETRYRTGPGLLWHPGKLEFGAGVPFDVTEAPITASVVIFANSSLSL